MAEALCLQLRAHSISMDPQWLKKFIAGLLVERENHWQTLRARCTVRAIALAVRHPIKLPKLQP